MIKFPQTFNGIGKIIQFSMCDSPFFARWFSVFSRSRDGVSIGAQNPRSCWRQWGWQRENKSIGTVKLNEVSRAGRPSRRMNRQENYCQSGFTEVRQRLWFQMGVSPLINSVFLWVSQLWISPRKFASNGSTNRRNN